MRPRQISLLAPLLLASSCTTTETVRGMCGSPPYASVCVGPMTVRSDRVDEFRRGSKLAVDAIGSAGFEHDLQLFIDTHARGGRHADAWRGVTSAHEVVNGLLEAVGAVSIRTMNDLMGAAYRLRHNVALEGHGAGPILVNPFYMGSAANYANTIAHEAAHRPPLRLSHPHYGGSTRDVGECEPPYVIGSLVQKQIGGRHWEPDADDCPLLATLLAKRTPTRTQ